MSQVSQRLAISAALLAACASLYLLFRTRRRARIYQSATLRTTAMMNERSRIARQLHDGLAQSLNAISFRVSSAQYRLNMQPDQAEAHLTHAREQVVSCLKDLRSAIEDLRPQLLESLRLSEALREFSVRLQQCTTPCPIITLTLPELPVILPEVWETALFSIASEALTNAARHSGAERIQLILRASVQGLIQLLVIDDGRGFSSEAVRHHPRHIGLIGMRERVEQCGASLTIASDDEGTRLEMTFPLIPSLS